MYPLREHFRLLGERCKTTLSNQQLNGSPNKFIIETPGKNLSNNSLNEKLTQRVALPSDF